MLWPGNDLQFYSLGYSSYGFSAVPLPGAVWLTGSALAALAAYRSKMNR